LFTLKKLGHLFVAGVPATGKTWLGTWLAQKQGYMHIDAEKDDGVDFDDAGIHEEWDEMLDTGRAKKFVAAINRLPKQVIINWGLAMEALFVVTALEAEGFEAWWLNAVPAQARKAFIIREKKKPLEKRIPIECFDRQMAEITRYWSLVERVFGDRIIHGLKSDGSQRRPEDLWAEIAAA
jgi:cytidylate kinase